MPILATKLHAPPLRSTHIARLHLVERLSGDAQRRLVLVSAPAGFGKTTLICEWLAQNNRPMTWLSLDEDDNDPIRFLPYLVAALQKIKPDIGLGVLRTLQTPQPPPPEIVLTTLLNEIAEIATPFTLVFDDYHVITELPMTDALSFFIEHAASHMQVVIATREDPHLPLHKLRAQGELTEVRAADLRFTHAEAVRFLTEAMSLKLSAKDVAALETRTEGWIVGLQLAALSMQGMRSLEDAERFVQTFAGSHRFVLDYLLEEVLHKQPAHVQHFLLHTSMLGKMCGPLCEAVMGLPSTAGQDMLAYLEQANLFIIPLDNERRWYRYHHLFADLLQQRLRQEAHAESKLNELHTRASQWFEDNGFELEAFRHAAATRDIDRAERLSEGKGIPLHYRGAALAILNWLEGLPKSVLKSRPSLWWRHAAMLLVNGHTTGVKEKLDAVEEALQEAQSRQPTPNEPADAKTRNLIGQIATARATLALTHYDTETMLAQSQRALEFLGSERVSTRANAYWTLGYAYLNRKDFVAAHQAFAEAIALSQSIGATFTVILATIGLGLVQEAENQLHRAAQTYRHVLQLAGDQPLQIIAEAHLGLARVLYEWNDLAGAQHHGEQSLQLARQYDRVIDRFIVGEVFLARLKLARGDVSGAADALAQSYQTARQRNFVLRLPEVAAAQVITLLRQGLTAEAMQLVQTHDLPLCRAQICLAQGDAPAALAILENSHQHAQAQTWTNEWLSIAVLQAAALHMRGKRDEAIQRLGEVLKLAEPEGFIRLFVDLGSPMKSLLAEAAAHGQMPIYVGKLRAAFEAEPQPIEGDHSDSPVEPLSQRELEVLRLIAQGLSNNEIGERLFLALDTVKGHNRKIFEKLQVQRRTEAVAIARKLGLL